MNTVQRIAKNAGVLITTKVLSKVFTFFYVMYTARYLGAEGFGILSFAIAFTAIFGIFTDLGLHQLTVREVARDKSLAGKYLANISLIKAILAVITFGLIILTANLLGCPEQTIKVVCLFALFVIFQAFTQMFYSIFQAFEKMEYQSAGQVLNGLLMLTGVICAMKYGLDVVGFACIYTVCSVLVLFYSFAVTKLVFLNSGEVLQPGLMQFDRYFWKQAIKEAWPMGAKAICVMIYFRIDAVMLSLMKGDTAVGLYSAAYRLSEISIIIPAMFMSAIFPVLSVRHKHSRDTFLNVYEKSFKYMLYLSLPMALTVTLLAQPIISLIFQNEFSGSAAALQVLIWAAACMYVTMVLGSVLVAADKQILNLKIIVTATALNIILNLVIIPKYGYIGASATTVATEVFGLCAGMYFLKRYGYQFNIRVICMSALLGLVVAGVVAFFLYSIGANIFIVSAIAMLAYGLIVWRTGIGGDDKELIRKAFNVSRAKA